MACVFIEGNFQVALGIFAAVCMLVIIFAKPLSKKQEKKIAKR
jgi:membrane protein implicated in regulation of membrane protease activity